MSDQPAITDRAVELMQELVAEIAATAEKRRLEEQKPVTVHELAERTGQTAVAIYGQIARRSTNGLEQSGALLKPPGARRGWRVQPDLYVSWLSGESPS